LTIEPPPIFITYSAATLCQGKQVWSTAISSPPPPGLPTRTARDPGDPQRQGDRCQDYRRNGHRAVPFALGVSESTRIYPIEYQKHWKTHAEKVLSVVSAAAKLAGVVCDMLHTEHEHVYQAIIEAGFTLSTATSKISWPSAALRSPMRRCGAGC